MLSESYPRIKGISPRRAAFMGGARWRRETDPTQLRGQEDFRT